MTKKFREDICTECGRAVCDADENMLTLKSCPEYINQHMKVIDTGHGEIIAISKYNGKTVKAKAVCSPNDEFDYKVGKDLAIARCNEKVAYKRWLRANAKLNALAQKLQDLEEEKFKVALFFYDATQLCKIAQEERKRLEKEVGLDG